MSRKKPLAALAGTLSAAITLTLATPGAASAQSGSRLCGVSWKSVKSGEMITRVYEVPKDRLLAFPACVRGTRRSVAVRDSPFANRLSDKDLGNWATFRVRVQVTAWSWRLGQHQVTRWVNSDFAGVGCEAWRDRSAERGGLAGRDLKFIGDNWPKRHHQADICENMNRSDTVFEMQLYWLYDDNDPATAAVDFQRG